MAKYIVENVFEHKGLKCIVIQEISHRCGYVGISKEHCLYGKDYDDYIEIKKPAIGDRKASGIFPLIDLGNGEDEQIRIGAYLQCHSGITFAGGGEKSKYPIESDLWWFGFNCAEENEAQTLEYVTIECKKLAVQLAIMKEVTLSW